MVNYELIFGAGLVGALAREVFRWRNLYNAGRIEKFTTPLYCGIALSICILSAAIAVIFSPLMPAGDESLPVAFVIGAGAELVVLWAARLKMPPLPMPRLPMGTHPSEAGNQSRPADEPGASIHEFLRA